MNSSQNYPILNLPFLYKYGLTIQNSTSINGTLNPEKKLSILAGMCRDSNDNIDIRLGDSNPNQEGVTTSAPVRIDNTKAGVGGLDEGDVLADTMYAIYIIADSRGYLPVSAIATLGLNIYRVGGPLMPAGYDSSRFIGFWATDSNTDWLTGYYFGLGNDLLFTYDEPQATSVVAGTSNSYTYVDLLAFVPDIHNIPVSILTVFSPGAASDTLTLASGRSTEPGGQVVITGQVSGVNVTSVNSVIAQHVIINPAPLPLPVIQYKVSGSDSVAIYVAGFSVSV